MYQAGLVLEGGGMKGVYTAGVLDFFTEKGIDFSHIYGVSAGACHMCSYLSRQKGRALSVSVDYLDTRRYCSLESLLTSGDLFNVDFCYHLIPDYLYPYDYDTFEKYPGKAYSVVTNIETGQPEYLRVRDIRKDIDKIRASASLPLVARNVKIDGKLYLEPRDDNRFGFRVGCTGSEYVLYQYLDPFDLIDTDDMCFSEYFREVARTPDLKKMKKCLWMLANRYTEDVVYTIPLSLDTYTESAGLKHIGRRSYCAWGRKDNFTAAEKKALESVKNYVKKF